MTQLPDDYFTLEFSCEESHGRIRNFDASPQAQVATELNGWDINVYDDVRFSYSINPSWSHCQAVLDWEGETLLIYLNTGFAVKIYGYEDYAVYQLPDTKETKEFFNSLRDDTKPLDVGNKHYFMKDGNLLYTENGSAYSFYIADNAEFHLAPWLLLIVVLVMIPITIQKLREGDWKFPSKQKNLLHKPEEKN